MHCLSRGRTGLHDADTGLPMGFIVDGFPVFCLERWQSLHETSTGLVLSESGGEPPSIEELESYGVNVEAVVKRMELGYGWTKGLPRLRELIASRIYSDVVDAEHIVVTSGGAEANLLAVLATIAPGSLAIVDVPNYLQVWGLLAMRSARVYEYRRRSGDWSLEPDRLAELIDALRPKAVFVTNPNNPTGRVERSLGVLAEAAARHDTILVFDEVYRGLELSGPRTSSVLEAAESYGAVAISTGSLSKTYSLPGLRIGWVATNNKQLAEKLWSVKDYTTISTSRLSEELAAAVLEAAADKLAERTRRIAARNLELLSAACGVDRVHRPEAGAFTLIRVKGSDVVVAEELLRKHNILVVPGTCMKASGYIRVSLGIADSRRARDAYIKLCSALTETEGLDKESS